ncbi:hypothetical protein JCM17960_04530 [Magnetospira thiophila]
MDIKFPTAGMALAATVAYSLCLGGTPASAADSFSFGLWGDMPYAKNNDQPKMQALIDSLNASDIAFSLFDGDIKDGSSECTDSVFTDAATLFNSLKAPLVYVPGDNEWTDCHRKNNNGYDNLERLDHLRRVMFPKAESFGASKMALDLQGKPGEKFSENTRFVHGDVVFVGINMPGSNNNKVNNEKSCTKKSARTPEQCAADNVEYAERDAANIAWMDEAFKLASDQKARGIVLAFQADPGFDLPETEDLDERADASFDGFTKFLDRLVAHARNFDGQILLVHGDTHFFKYDKPMLHQADLIPNVTRLQTFGSPNIHWVRVTVDPAAEQVFVIHPVIVPGN